MALTRLELETKLNRLFDLRSAYQQGEKLTISQFKEIGYYRELLNEWFTQNASFAGITASFTVQFSLRFETAESQYIAIETGTNLSAPEAVVPSQTPSAPVRIENNIDPANPLQSIRNFIAAGQSVEQGTKQQDFSREQGVFNEFSVSATFIETIKNTIAQQVDRSLVVAVAPVTVISVESSLTATIELIKSDVAQIIQSGEREIDRPVQLDVFTSDVYGDVESSIRTISIKQDSLDPRTELIRTAQNPFTVTQAQLATEALVLLSVQEAASQLREFEKNQLFEEQAAAVESFTGGG